MTTINRRDYLKKMAVGAAAIAGSKLDVFAQRARRRRRRRPETPTPKPARRDPSILNWSITQTRPSPDAFVTAIFAGLMGFTYDPQSPGQGKVGFHGHEDHNLIVKIYRIEGGVCTLNPQQPQATNKKITLGVMPTSNQPVNYYEYNPGVPLDRFAGDAYDFRWLPDLDGPDFYPDNYDAHSDHFKRWLYVKNATFYTRMRTNSKFNLVTQDSDLTKPNALIKPFGYVARYMAAAIELPADGEYVALKVDSNPAIELRPAPGVKYQIVFSNECGICPPPSQAELEGNDERLRSDFHYARKVLKLPGSRVKIALKLDGLPASSSPQDFCRIGIVIRNTDAAPCMGAGYGGGDNP
ncbi:MAG TPA: hypothetical protein VLL54_19375 [Pyrinomonadaceae bacterium]|nr:hypothetical protein [Pyrinomonadaceae bacterium]